MTVEQPDRPEAPRAASRTSGQRPVRCLCARRRNRRPVRIRSAPLRRSRRPGGPHRPVRRAARSQARRRRRRLGPGRHGDPRRRAGAPAACHGNRAVVRLDRHHRHDRRDRVREPGLRAIERLLPRRGHRQEPTNPEERRPGCRLLRGHVGDAHQRQPVRLRHHEPAQGRHAVPGGERGLADPRRLRQDHELRRRQTRCHRAARDGGRRGPPGEGAFADRRDHQSAGARPDARGDSRADLPTGREPRQRARPPISATSAPAASSCPSVSPGQTPARSSSDASRSSAAAPCTIRPTRGRGSSSGSIAPGTPTRSSSRSSASHRWPTCPFASADELVGMINATSADEDGIARLTESLPALLEFAGIAGVILGPTIKEMTEPAGAVSGPASSSGRGLSSRSSSRSSTSGPGHMSGSRRSPGSRPARPRTSSSPRPRDAGMEHDLEIATLAAAIEASSALPKDSWLSLNVRPA